MAKEIELPPETLSKIREAETSINLLESFIAKASSAGIDVNEARQKLQNNKSRLSQIRRAFYPLEP